MNAFSLFLEAVQMQTTTPGEQHFHRFVEQARDHHNTNNLINSRFQNYTRMMIKVSLYGGTPCRRPGWYGRLQDVMY